MRLSFLLPVLVSPVLCGCLSSRWINAHAPRTPPAAASAFRDPLSAGQLVIHSDFYLPPGHRMISELTSERQLICDRLGIPAGKEPIHVFLFADESDYRDHVARKYPDFPERRAIFVETDVRLRVYAHWSDHVAQLSGGVARRPAGNAVERGAGGDAFDAGSRAPGAVGAPRFPFTLATASVLFKMAGRRVCQWRRVRLEWDYAHSFNAGGTTAARESEKRSRSLPRDWTEY
jgi:hypothetical protein